MASDQFILKQLHQGNRLVFKNLFEKYYYALKGFSTKFIDRNDICDDIVQDAFIVLWKNREQIKNISALKSYLYTIVRNSCLTYIRDKKSKSVIDDKIKILESESFFEETIIEEEVYSEVYKAIKGLSPQARKIVILSMNGLTNPEIAEDLQVSVNTVKTLKKVAYKKLREQLKGIHWVTLLMLV